MGLQPGDVRDRNLIGHVYIMESQYAVLYGYGAIHYRLPLDLTAPLRQDTYVS
jgi:hypothetical protein